MKSYSEWMEDFIAINSNPKLKTVGIPMTRKEYFKIHFPKNFNPKDAYDQDIRVTKELIQNGVIQEK